MMGGQPFLSGPFPRRSICPKIDRRGHRKCLRRGLEAGLKALPLTATRKSSQPLATTKSRTAEKGRRGDGPNRIESVPAPAAVPAVAVVTAPAQLPVAADAPSALPRRFDGTFRRRAIR